MNILLFYDFVQIVYSIFNINSFLDAFFSRRFLQCFEANDHVGYENYRHVCHKWHYKITRAMVFCLDSKDYMQIRNALIILIRILPYFPILSKLAQIVEKRVEKVINEERNQRQDLFTLATSYIGQLKNKSNDMIREADFHQVSDKPSKTPTENAKVTNGTANNTPIVIIGMLRMWIHFSIRPKTACQ